MMQSVLIANRSKTVCRIIRAKILPGTGRGTIRRMVEGQGRSRMTLSGCVSPMVPLHQLRWSPFPGGGGIMIESLLVANRGEIACRMFRPQILPETGRGTMRSILEGQGSGCMTSSGCVSPMVPLHHLRWSPSPGGGGML
jgi:hypothetical protein